MSDSESIEFSDEPQTITWETAKRFKLVFGQHRGKRLAILVKSAKNRDYLRYLLSWENIRPDTAANISCVLNHYEEVKKTRDL
jgi:hypothetical protein